MISPPNDPMETLKRKAVIFILGLTSLAAMIATVLHTFEPKPHLISLILPPFTAIVCLSLVLYLMKYPDQIYRVIKISIGWSYFIFLFPEYFFVIEAFLDDKKLLVDTLPPISSAIFLITTIMIVFLRPRGLVRLALLLWIVTAAPIVCYLIVHPAQLRTPRGMDLIITLVPAMGINISLLLFYSRLQDAIDKLYVERFHLKEVSEKDALTSVFNRGAGERILQNLIDRPERKIGIILCDIDHFKRVNDTYGHLSGDRVLQTIARCCQTNLRSKDTLIRWGGEEFLVVVPGDDLSELENLAERLRRIIADQQIPEVGKVTASFGVAFLNPQENLTQLFSRADQALYQAKGNGRNQVVLAGA
jgi:diguanylate cyclase (GGDEF)-like protein